MEYPLKQTVIIIIITLSVAAHAIASGAIKMGYFNLAPHIIYNESSKKLEGASFDYFTALASAMKYEIEWVGPLPFPRLTRYLKTGVVDGSLMMSKNPERESFLLYPDMPYHWVQRILVVKKESQLDNITSINDVLGFRIGFMENAHLSPFIKDNRDKITLDLIGGKDWVTQNLLKLGNGRLDAVYDLNAETMWYAAKRLDMADKIKILAIPEPPGGVNVVFSRKAPMGSLLLESYQQKVRELKPVYREFLKFYID